MQIGKKLQNALNEQIQAELYSAYLYLSMSNYCIGKNLKGFGHWMKLQYQEETEHALKILGHLLDRGGTVNLKEIDAPPADFGTPVKVFEQVLKHEQHVTSLIHKLYDLALAEKDRPGQIFLEWFITEQVEEEANASDILAKLQMIPDKSSAILYLDKELGKRVAE